ncbi:MAG: glycosyltransferase family 39 protein [Chloroflexi bacterium]|nr:glycosyltransferase family 39 protein [Chloroflexota bacterium]
METPPPAPRTSVRVIAGTLFWLLLALFLYYWVHKPVTPTFVRSFGGAIIDLLSVTLLVLVAAGLGRTLIRYIAPTYPNILSQPEQLAGEALFGLGILSILIFVVGLVWLHAISVLVLLGVIVFFTRQNVFGWGYHLYLWLDASRPHNRLDRWLLAFIIFSLALGLIMALAPPTKFDALTYHLVGPKLWVENGRFESLPGNHFFGFPQLVHTLFAAEMALTFGRLTGGAVVHWAFGSLSLMAIGGYGWRRFSPCVGILAVAILLAAPSIWLQFGWPYVDLPPIGFAMLMFIALEQWHEQHSDTRWLILASVFIGFAMSVKYPLICLGLSAGFYVLIHGKRTRWLQNGAIMVGVASLVLAPWLLRNLLFYDNPIYPFGPHTGDWDSLTSQWYTNSDTALLHDLPGLYWTTPITSTVFGIDGAGGFAATIGPLFLFLIPLLLLSWKKLEPTWRKSIQGMTIIIAGVFIFWMASAATSVYGAQTRLWYAMFPMLVLIAAIGFDGLRYLPTKPLDLRFVIQALLILIFTFTAIDYVRGVRPKNDRIEGTTLVSHFLDSHALDYLMGVMPKNEYLDENLGWHIEAMRQVNKLPDGSRVLFLWETRSLYCDEPRIECVEDWILLRWWHDRRTLQMDNGQLASADTILNEWRRRGITHILVWEAGRDFEFDDNARITDADKTEWEKVPAQLEIVWQQKDEYSLYTLSQ